MQAFTASDGSGLRTCEKTACQKTCFVSGLATQTKPSRTRIAKCRKTPRSGLKLLTRWGWVLCWKIQSSVMSVEKMRLLKLRLPRNKNKWEGLKWDARGDSHSRPAGS